MDETRKALPADEVVAPGPSAEMKIDAASLPNDADDTSDAGKPTTDHEAEGWRKDGPSTP